MQDLKITLIQFNLFWEDKEANLYSFAKAIEEIQEPSDIIVLPEMFNTGFSMMPEKFSEPIDGQTLAWMQTMAGKTKTAIVGSFMVEENKKFYNRLFFVEPNGNYSFYDKRHLFRMGGEDQHFSAGEMKLIHEYKGWKINFLICYDLRFPVWAKNNFNNGKYDYDLLLIVANWPAVRSRVWTSLLTARAIENQVYVVGVNRIGNDGNGLPHSGNSNVFDAKGIPLLQETENKHLIKTIGINKAELDDFRNKFTVGLDWDIFTIQSAADKHDTTKKYKNRNVQKDYNG